MDLLYHSRFLLLDFGHPLTLSTFNIMIKSLQNIISLCLVFPPSGKDFDVGISIINSNFTLVYPFSHMRKNYNLIIQILDSLSNTIKINHRDTVHEYKHLLFASIEMILHKLQKKGKNEWNPPQKQCLYMTVVTMKTASLLAEILSNVTRKLQSSNSDAVELQKIKIVQILNEQREEKHGSTLKSNCFIDWTTCFGNVHDIDCIFKDWLMNQDWEQQYVRIQMSKEIDLVVKCDVEDCVVNTISTPFASFSSSYDKLFNGPNKRLDVIYRIQLSALRPTLVFGSPSRLYATQNSTLSWTEVQMNNQIFKHLCQELQQTGQGLLVRSSNQVDGNRIDTFHCITSDGQILIMNNVAPDELCLPARQEVHEPVSDTDENAIFLVRSSLQKIEVLREFAPEKFSSGTYEYLRNFLMRTGERKSLFGHFDPSVKLFGRNSRTQSHHKNDSSTGGSIRSNPMPGQTKSKHKKKSKDESPFHCGQYKKKQKSATDARSKHPALLSPETADKYRRVNHSVFNLPELGQTFNEGLI